MMMMMMMMNILCYFNSNVFRNLNYFLMVLIRISFENEETIKNYVSIFSHMWL